MIPLGLGRASSAPHPTPRQVPLLPPATELLLECPSAPPSRAPGPPCHQLCPGHQPWEPALGDGGPPKRKDCMRCKSQAVLPQPAPTPMRHPTPGSGAPGRSQGMLASWAHRPGHQVGGEEREAGPRRCYLRLWFPFGSSSRAPCSKFSPSEAKDKQIHQYVTTPYPPQLLLVPATHPSATHLSQHVVTHRSNHPATAPS